jgi:hypothetical protein
MNANTSSRAFTAEKPDEPFAVELLQTGCAPKKIKRRTAKKSNGTWDHAALKVEHEELINSGSIAPTRMLAARYGVSVACIRNIIAGLVP